MDAELEVRALRQRVSKLETYVNFLYKHFGVTFVPAPFSLDPADAEVANCLKKGDTVGALRAYRAIHGVSVDEAKATVDEIKAGLGY